MYDSQAKDFERGLRDLLNSPEYQELVRIAPQFDLFGALDSGLSENASTRALSYFFDSSREHGCGTSVMARVLERLTPFADEKQRALLDGLRSSLEQCSTSVKWEWSTAARRRIDLLVQIRDADRSLKGVIGIENKHDAIEQKRQIESYQLGLYERYRPSPMVLLFLAPSGREPQTACEVYRDKCPCLTLPYKLLCEALRAIDESPSPDVRFFGRCLRDHLERELEGGTDMDRRVNELVHALYRRPEHREAIRRIIDNVPSLGKIRDSIANELAGRIRRAPEFGNDIVHTIEYYPTYSQTDLQQIILKPPRLRSDSGQFPSLTYILEADRDDVSSKTVPDIGDPVRVCLWAYCESAAQRRLAECIRHDLEASQRRCGLQESVPGLLTEGRREPIWAGVPWNLDDLGDRDVDRCAGLFMEALKHTYHQLLEILDKLGAEDAWRSEEH